MKYLLTMALTVLCCCQYRCVDPHTIDMGSYYRIPADNRDLNYAKYFSEGETDISTLDDYTSHNTKRLNVEEVKALLLTLDYIKEELNA